MTGTVVDAADDRLATASSRLASCHEEIRRLRKMRRHRAWTRGRMNCELKLVLPLLRLRERIPDVFWRIFVLVIGTSACIAVAFLATRNSSFTATAVGSTAAITATMLTLLVLLPTDSLLDRRRLVLSQVAASADNEHQNVCSQLQFLRQRRDTIRSQLALLQQPTGFPDVGHQAAPEAAPIPVRPVDDLIPVDSSDSPQPTE